MSHFCNCAIDLVIKIGYKCIISKSFGWNWFSSYQLIVYIEREMTTLLCNECGKSFTDEPLLYIHQTRQHDKTSYSCGECGTEVIGKMVLNNHKRSHKMPAVNNTLPFTSTQTRKTFWSWTYTCRPSSTLVSWDRVMMFSHNSKNICPLKLKLSRKSST